MINSNRTAAGVTMGFAISPEVDAALRGGRPVVALESAVVTHGLPRAPLSEKMLPPLPAGVRFAKDKPANLATAFLLDECVRAGGAIPAMVAVIEGTLRVGLSESEMAQLAEAEDAMKVAARDLPGAMALGKTGGTTVSATLAACARCGDHGGPGLLRIFATGGIGGAHRGWARSGDISADLNAIARTPTCVVSAGAKSLLDLAATVEMLETLSVPVVGFNTDHFPQFQALGKESIRVPLRLDDLESVARLCRCRWDALQAAGVLLAVPIPESEAIDAVEMETILAIAEERARVAKITGPEWTPFVLAAMASESGGRLVRANLALLINNASIAARLAHALSTDSQRL